MGRRIMEPVVRSDGMTPRSQTLHAERSRPHATQSSKSPNFRLVAYDDQGLIEAPEGDETSHSTAMKIAHTASQTSLVSSHDAPSGSHEIGTTTSDPKDKVSSHSFSNNVSESTAGNGTMVFFSDTVQPISQGLSNASVSLSTEKTPPVADVQSDDDDDPMYRIGQTKVFHQIQKAIEPAYEARWEMIFAEISDRVLSKLRQRRFGPRSNRPRGIPNIQLMSADTTRDTSVPAVVVAISKNVKNMQAFLDTDTTVQLLCEPRDGTTVELQVLACKDDSTLVGSPAVSIQPVTLIFKDKTYPDSRWDDEVSILSTDSDSSPVIHGMNDDIQLYAEFPSVVFENRNPSVNLKSGMGIPLVSKDGSRCVRGTCGGFLQLEYPLNSPRQVGLIAGHLLEQLTDTSNNAIQGNYETKFPIRDILYPRNLSEIPRYDWALFDAAKLSLKYDMPSQPKLTIAQKSEFPRVNTAVSIRTSRGEVMGTLSSSTSGIMLNPDHGFVYVRVIIMDKGSVITKGDSGAWVIDERVGKIYGHVIATGGNGDAYMVALHATITEIKPIFGAMNVSLVTAQDPSCRNSFGNQLCVYSTPLSENQRTHEWDSAYRVLKKDLGA